MSTYDKDAAGHSADTGSGLTSAKVIESIQVDAKYYWLITSNGIRHVRKSPFMLDGVIAQPSYTEVGGEEALASKCLTDIFVERKRQDAKYGGAVHDDAHTYEELCQFVKEKATVAKLCAHYKNHVDLRLRLIQTAALAIATVESMDRKIDWENPQ